MVGPGLPVMRIRWMMLGLGLMGLAGAQEALAANLDPSNSGVEGAARAWNPAVLIEAGAGQAYSPQIATDAHGNAIAVWRQYDGSGNRVWANRYLAGAGWGTAAIIQNRADPVSPPLNPPQIAMDANGNAFVVWEEFDAGSTSLTSIRARPYIVGQGWGAVQLIESGADTAYAPQVGMDANGNAIVVWAQASFGLYRTRANRYVAGTGWGSDVRIDNSSFSNYPPQIAMGADGNAVAVWTQYNGTVAANRYTAGSGWNTAVSIAPNSHDPQVAVSPDGFAYVVWVQHDGLFYRIYSKRYRPISGWDGDDEIVDSDLSDVLGYPDVAVDGAGNAFAAWTRNEGGRSAIYVAKHPVLTDWGLTLRIDWDWAGSSGAPQIAVNANGDAFAAWHQRDSLRSNAWACRRLAGEPYWDSAELIETDDTGSAYDPRVVVAPDSAALAVWRQYDGTRDNIWASRIDSDIIFKDGFDQ